jgi:hypothetical protein
MHGALRPVELDNQDGDTTIMKRAGYKTTLAVLVLILGFGFASTPRSTTQAADHSEAPFADEDRPNDLADVFAFLDPNDNSRLVIAFTLVGFIVPSEMVNQGAFDPHSRYRIELEETGDARADRFIDITFSARTSRTAPQMATIVLPDGRRFMAPTTVPTLDNLAPTRTLTTDPATNVSFFAGVVDDPFFFDIPGFNRFVASVQAGSPDVTQLQRGRDSFAGYNDLGVAISVPITLLNFTNDTIGVDVLTQRQIKRTFKKNTGEFVYKGPFSNIDRMGNPAINTVLIPFARKDEYNLASTQDDAGGRFADDIIATLTSLGTNEENIGILAGVAVLNGDFLRVNRTVQNMGSGGGNNVGAGFPNGRRLVDDTVDTILFFVANQNELGDSVPNNDVPLTNTFPFFGLAQQPRETGVVDDLTRN